MKFCLQIVVSALLCLSVNFLSGQSTQSGERWLFIDEKDSLVLNVPPVSSNYNDFSPVFLHNVLYFSSDRKNRYTDEADLKYNYNVMNSNFEGKNFRKPRHDYFFNNDDYTSLAGFSPDGSKLFVYKTFGNGDIYVSERNKKEKWKRPRRLSSPVNSEFTEQSIAWSDHLIVISSNRQGGEHFNLFWGYNHENIKNVEFQPLVIANTGGNEIDVSFGPDGRTLYFSSDGRGGAGGFDIYYTVFENGTWKKPENLGPEYNTIYDDRWFMDADSLCFFSSGRTVETGLNIYMGKIIPREIRDTVVEIVTIDTVETPELTEMDVIDQINEYLDSLEFEVYVAYIQVGAFYFIKSLEEFKKRFEIFASTEMIIEKIETEDGILHKYILNKEYKTLREASVKQKEALAMQIENNRNNPSKLREDAFIAVYNSSGDRILIYFNVERNEYKILIGDKYVYF
jgi:hypothetical protein